MKSTIIRRDKGIPGSNAKQRINDMNGPIQQRSSLTSEQRPSQRRPTQPTSSTPVMSDIIDLATLEVEPEREDDTENDFGQEDELDSKEPHEEKDQTAMTTHNMPQQDEYQDEATYSRPRRRASYVTSQPTHQYSSTPAATSRTRELRNGTRPYSTTEHPIERAGNLNRTRTNYHQPAPTPLPKRQHHPLLWIGLTLLVVVMVYIVVVPWCIDRYNDIRYRSPRIDYTYAMLGTNDDSAHQSLITAINNHGQVIITLYPGNNKPPVAYEIQTTNNTDKAPATIEIIAGKTASIKYIAIHYNGSSIILSYENNTLKRIM